jgi:glutathione S-transferase
MTKPKLTYFDAPMSRGEECRLALHVSGVDFEDVRVKREAWPAMKPTTPFGSMPLFEMPGHPVLAQSIAILTLIGRKWGLHPKDELEAARHEAMMQYGEELRAALSPSLRMTDEAEKKKAREALVANYFPTWGANVEKQIGAGPFFGGSAINVVDFKLYMIVRWFLGGKIDHVPATVFAGFPKLMRLHDAVRDHAKVKEWNARFS